MAYVPFPIVDVDVTSLRLDLQNYRIPSRPKDELRALAYLFASEEVLEAAKQILRDGYFDNEVPIVTEDDDPGFVVLEGNRRVSALKALQSPELVPSHTTQIQELLKRYDTERANLPTSIRVLVAPDRSTARPHIARLHTGLSKKRWSRDQQATFYYSLIENGSALGELKREYPGVSISRFVKMAVVRRFLNGVRFEDPGLREYVAGSALTMSAFEYAYRSREIASAVGIEFEADGTLTPKGKTPEEIGEAIPQSRRVALEYLVGEFQAGRFNTRSLAFKKATFEHQELVDRLSGNRQKEPGVEGSANGRHEDGGVPSGENGGNGGAAPGTNGQVPRGPNHPDTKTRLDLTGIDYGAAPVNLQRRYHELRGIKITEFPVTAAILLRSIFEMTIKWHFEAAATPVSGMLKDVFAAVDSAYGSQRPLKNTIAVIRSADARRPGSVSWFNHASHDVNAVIKAEDVLQAWEQVNPLLRHLLRQPSDA